MTDNGPQTREEWLENNRLIMEQEGETEKAIFYNQIETRLGLAIELREPADERLGDAYVACLARYEAQPDFEFDNEPWAPYKAATLIDIFGITPEEAEVIVAMAKEEYE